MLSYSLHGLLHAALYIPYPYFISEGWIIYTCRLFNSKAGALVLNRAGYKKRSPG